MIDMLNWLDDVMYYPILIIVMACAGLFFTIRTKGVQIRLFPHSVKLLMEPAEDKKNVSSLQAMLVSTASRVGTGNIVGVSTAICLGGPGACFWMWVMCIIGASSAFIESTLAQIYKRRNADGESYGGPAYYIERALHAPFLAGVFCVFLIATYAVGFNLLCSYNLQSTFATYSFYDETITPAIIGAILALLTGYCLLGGGKRIVKLTSLIVPVMGISYVLISLIVIFVNIGTIPAMFGQIFSDAFDFKAIFGGVAGSCMIYGIKRGLYSNEAGVGSAPNASASAKVSHPAKQGLVQTLSVYIDTLLLCTATALMCLSTGVERSAKVSGAPYVQNAISTVFGKVGPTFITVAMILFAFTTLLGNLFYVDNALIFLNHKKQPSKKFMKCFHIGCVLIVFLGALIKMDAAWAVADITMGGMTLINLPACMMLGGVAVRALKDYEKQRKAGKKPVFYGKNIGLNEENLDFWKTNKPFAFGGVSEYNRYMDHFEKNELNTLSCEERSNYEHE
ncbi:MAG: alanine:cation symporter family protein [Lachnospiraceae bacterium]|nr:alanine:cation symporter family protein [Lachnospiraceae bacterium]